MNNNISFSGIKNMSYNFDKTIDLSDRVTRERWLSVELTGHDLHKFKRALKRSRLDKKDYANPIQKNFLNINTFSLPSEDCIAINNSILEVNDDTLPMYTEIARITRKILKKKKSDFIVDENYLNSKAFNKALLMDVEVDDLIATKLHMPESVKKGTKNINVIIQRIMERYFAE